RTSNLCGCTGGFHTRCPAADDNDVARFAYLMLLIVFALCDCRVDRTADRAVDADTVSGASDVAGDTFPDITDIAKFYLVHPLRISDQPAPDSDQVSVTSCKDILRNVRITDITHGDTGLIVFLLDCLCHVG